MTKYDATTPDRALSEAKNPRTALQAAQQLNASDVERRRRHFDRALANLDVRFGATWYPGISIIDDAMDSYEIAAWVCR